MTDVQVFTAVGHHPSTNVTGVSKPTRLHWRACSVAWHTEGNSSCSVLRTGSLSVPQNGLVLIMCTRSQTALKSVASLLLCCPSAGITGLISHT